MKVGDKVKVLGGYGGAFCGRVGVVTELSDGWCMVTTRKGLPDHTGDSDRPDDDFHLCFLKGQVSAPIQQATGTLAELGVRPGDVVEFVEERSNPYGYEYPNGPATVLDRGLVFGIKPEYDDAIWRIVPRAPDHEKNPSVPVMPGPVVTETVTYTKIVPGTFGPVKIERGDLVCDVIVAPLNTDDMDQMIAARDILSQLIDAMADE